MPTLEFLARITELEQALAAAEQRATRLAVLEAAARAVRQTNWDEYAGIEALVAAVAALDGPAGDAALPAPGGTVPSSGGR